MKRAGVWCEFVPPNRRQENGGRWREPEPATPATGYSRRFPTSADSSRL